jgi:hypothetical protein
MSEYPATQTRSATADRQVFAADRDVFAQVERWMETIREIAGEEGGATATVRLERLLANAKE